MYRRLLVPIDDSDRSIEMVGNAVGLARTFGAHITFFHAGSEVLPALSRGAGARTPSGKGDALLAKAEAAARAFGVACDSRQVVGEQTAAAIIETARDIGCDLVVMADTDPSSGTLSALLAAGLPLLVSRTGEPGTSAHAIGVIRDEHRSFAAVLHIWMRALGAARSADAAADPPLMRAIVHYIEAYPTTLHDPMEEDQLFRRLRKRTNALDAELDELQRQHLRERQLVADLARRVDALAAVSGAAAVIMSRDLDDAVSSYASLVWEHMGREEGVILPAAQRHLTDADWSAIDEAFARRRGPGGAEDGASRLFSRIVEAGRDLSLRW
ncbi:MAG TPA: universal stress protein [Rubrivivax sp.]